jgi:hypothetical protein
MTDSEVVTAEQLAQGAITDAWIAASELLR